MLGIEKFDSTGERCYLNYGRSGSKYDVAVGASLGTSYGSPQRVPDTSYQLYALDGFKAAIGLPPETHRVW